MATLQRSSGGTRAVRAPHPTRNPGVPLDLDWVRAARVNCSAVERGAAALRTRRIVQPDRQAAWLLRAITLMDLTTLSGQDTPGSVAQLCARARWPVGPDVLRAFGMTERPPQAAAVCVYHAYVRGAVEALAGSQIPVAAVSAGFPAGLSPVEQRIGEVRASVAAGAAEIDMVITRAHVLLGRWDALYQEVRACREASGTARLKVILATGELGTLGNVLRASLISMMAGADFIKTSTGQERVNATLPVGVVMARAIRSFGERTGFVVGLKPAGGIRTARQAIDWMLLVDEELGCEWLTAERFRLGASSLLDDVRLQLERLAHARPSCDGRDLLARI